MNQHTITVLEYERVKNAVGAYCMSSEGKEFFDTLLPLTDTAEIIRRKTLARSWASLLQRGFDAPLCGWQPVGEYIKKLGIKDFGLDCTALFDLGCFAKNTGALQNVFAGFVHSSIPPTIDGFELLSTEIAQLPDLSSAVSLIFAIIDPSGAVRDLPELRAIRASIKNLRRNIDTLMQNYVTTETLKPMLQSLLPTQKDGRAVLAVKSNFKGRIKGIVHEVSQTGQTIYLEPADIVECNNDLLQEEYRLSRETARILTKLTGDLAEFRSNFETARTQMIFLDCIHAVARWGIENRCVYAAERTSGFTLKQARHPLLGLRAVPIDIALPEDTRILIVTGPNTGGKTVSLKTAGLFVLMNQTGFPVPSAEETSIAYFDGVFADLGDEQSLDQSLSTFSAHMKNIGSMYQAATERSLILLDELGSGTDPEEGSALAMSLLDHFIERRSLVIATTHHSILKNYGYSKDGCMNASMEFDRDSLSPTYRMIMGVPGESCALDIAGRNGIDRNVIDRARGYLNDERADISALITSLTSRHEKLHELEKAKEKEIQMLHEDRRRIDLKELRLRQKEHELHEQGYRRLDIFLSESRSVLENLVRELREGEITREKTKAVKEYLQNLADDITAEKAALVESDREIAEFRATLQQQFSASQADGVPSNEKKTGRRARKLQSKNDMSLLMTEPKQAVSLEVGMNVRIQPSNTAGTLLRRERNGKWLVAAGTMKLTIAETDLQADDQPPSKSVSVDIVAPSDSGDVPVFELRLLGMRYEDAMKALEHQLDLAAVKNLDSFSIVHGKGEGVLQKGVHEMLRTYPGVTDYYFARPEDGGFGKTYVHMKN